MRPSDCIWTIYITLMDVRKSISHDLQMRPRWLGGQADWVVVLARLFALADCGLATMVTTSARFGAWV